MKTVPGQVITCIALATCGTYRNSLCDPWVFCKLSLGNLVVVARKINMLCAYSAPCRLPTLLLPIGKCYVVPHKLAQRVQLWQSDLVWQHPLAKEISCMPRPIVSGKIDRDWFFSVSIFLAQLCQPKDSSTWEKSKPDQGATATCQERRGGKRSWKWATRWHGEG